MRMWEVGHKLAMWACRGRPRSSNWSLPGAAPQLGRLVNVNIQYTNCTYYTQNTLTILTIFRTFLHRDINRVRASHIHLTLTHQIQSQPSITFFLGFFRLVSGEFSGRWTCHFTTVGERAAADAVQSGPQGESFLWPCLLCHVPPRQVRDHHYTW